MYLCATNVRLKELVVQKEDKMKKAVAEYILLLRDAKGKTHQAEDRPLYEKYLAGAAVLLALIEKGADKKAITDAFLDHECLWGQTWLQDPVLEGPSKAWGKVEKFFSH
jgi:hypothetical protein